MNRIEELEAEVARLRERVAALEEALDMLAKALEKARALRGDAPKEERCHVWGGDVSRWKLPEFAPTGNAGDPGARVNFSGLKTGACN